MQISKYGARLFYHTAQGSELGFWFLQKAIKRQRQRTPERILLGLKNWSRGFKTTVGWILMLW
jgi:hypothetical protein